MGCTVLFVCSGSNRISFPITYRPVSFLTESRQAVKQDIPAVPRGWLGNFSGGDL
jgi:hypothetical protein